MRYTCGAGLCNRLRVALSYLEYARNEGETLLFTWPLNDACNESFDMHFKPIDGLEITQETDRESGWEDRHGVFPHPDYEPNYDLLVPKYETEFMESPYNAVHIRSSEHWRENRQNPSKFLNWVKESKLPVWLATDLRQTQLFFTSIYEQIKTFADIKKSNRIEELYRHTGLKHAVVDLFMCVRAENFLGTEYSSFSETINAMREYPGDLVNG